METVQVRLNKELAEILDASVEKGVYTSKSEAVRDGIRKLFAPELKEEILIELKKRSKSKDFVSQKQIEEEFGL